ncbi:MAG: low affinity iron permease family protein [Chitinophagaceae bacterium]
MRGIYKKTEKAFEIFSGAALKIFSSSFTFILAIVLVIIYLVETPFSKQTFHNSIYDFILCFTFLGFFIIQKALNKFNAALHLKINELLSTHDKASNRMVSIEKKSEAELHELAKHYSTFGDLAEKEGDVHTAKSIEHMLDQKKEEKIKEDKQ